MKTTKVFSDLVRLLADPTIRVIRMRGGTRSGKTWAILQALNVVAQHSTRRRLISVVSETLPHLKRGAITDFENMLTDAGTWNINNWHDTDKKYSYSKGAIEFFSAADPSRVMGPARQWLYINEAINVSIKVWQQLAARTEEKIIIDYNPAYEFWADTVFVNRRDVATLDSTYLDNDALLPGQIAEIEANRELDPDWWKVYGLGLQGSAEGLVIKNWDIVNSLPPRDQWKEAYIGIDFGWSAPSAVSLIVLGPGGEVWIDQLAYGREMDTPDIADAVKSRGFGAGPNQIECIADGADPRAISELEAYGLFVTPTESKEIELGISIMNRYKKHYTAASLDTIKENRMYKYPELATGGFGPIPVKRHGHAKDAERYVFLNRLSAILDGWDITTSTLTR